jgi:hypothetical protein
MSLDARCETPAFETTVFAHQLHHRLIRFLDTSRAIPLSEIADFTSWKLLVPEELPKTPDGRRRPFSQKELTAVIQEMGRTMALPGPVTVELSGEHAAVLSIVAQAIQETYPGAQVIAEARDGLVYTILEQMKSSAAGSSERHAICFPYMGPRHPSAEAPMYSPRDSERIELVMNRARQILRDSLRSNSKERVPSDTARRDAIINTFIIEFNRWFDSDEKEGGPSGETKQLLDSMLRTQITQLSVDARKPLVLFDTYGYGVKVIIGAAQIKRLMPDAHITLGFIESFEHSAQEGQLGAIPTVAAGPLRDIRVEWPFVLTGLDPTNHLPLFRSASQKLTSSHLRWINMLLLLYNRAVIGRDEELAAAWKRTMREGKSPFSNPAFAQSYTFIDTP